MRKRLMMMVAAGAAFCTFAATPTVSNVKAQQRYPWNALFDIDCTIVGDTTDVGMTIMVKDLHNGRMYTPTNFTVVPLATAGSRRATWNLAADCHFVCTLIFFHTSWLGLKDENGRV